MKDKHYSETERLFVLNWMQKFCWGRANAKFRKHILLFMPSNITDRKFRFIVSGLISEGHIYSSAVFGYFFFPLIYPSLYDIEAGRHATLERKAKALSTLANCDKNLRKLEGINQGQAVFI